jgi:hypothetical protein
MTITLVLCHLWQHRNDLAFKNVTLATVVVKAMTQEESEQWQY